MEVSWGSFLLWGSVATALLTLLMAGAQFRGYTRMSLPFMLGTMLTPDRDHAAFAGLGAHFVVGLAFALPYVLIFESWGRATGWAGTAIGAVHAGWVLLVLMPALPGIHPRMASERSGPTPTRQLEPPGFLGLNYGRRTPLVALAAHLVYGALLGAFYEVAG